MQATVYVTETGSITNLLTSSPSDVPLNTPEGHDWIEGRHDAETKWIDGDEAKDRPETGLPKSHTLPRDTDWTVPDVPEGAEVVIDGHSAGTVDGDGLVLSFPEPGAYRVDLRSPFPWQPAACEVTVQ